MLTASILGVGLKSDPDCLGVGLSPTRIACGTFIMMPVAPLPVSTPQADKPVASVTDRNPQLDAFLSKSIDRIGLCKDIRVRHHQFVCVVFMCMTVSIRAFIFVVMEGEACNFILIFMFIFLLLLLRLCLLFIF